MPVKFFNVTIASDSISVSQGSGIYYIENEGLASVDFINTITGHTDDGLYELRVKTTGHYWTLNHNPGVSNGIRLVYGIGFATSHPDDYIIVRGTDKGNYVYEYWRGIIHNT
jgi:hypothetical protein